MPENEKPPAMRVDHYCKMKQIIYMIVMRLLKCMEKELSALLVRDLLVPIVYNAILEDLRGISSLLGASNN